MLEGLRARATQVIRTAIKQGGATAIASAHDILASRNGQEMRRIKTVRKTDLLEKPPSLIEKEAVANLASRLQQITYQLTDKKPNLREMRELVESGIRTGKIEHFGRAVFIKKAFVEEIMAELGIDTPKQEDFHRLVKSRAITRDAGLARQFLSLNRGKILERRNEQFLRSEYSYVTRDGMPITLTRTRNPNKTDTNDNNPGVTVISGTACTRRFWEPTIGLSFILDLADNGAWVYAFEDRYVGKNRTEFAVDDQLDAEAFSECFLDAVISNDLPITVKFILESTKGKPTILIGHSKGGATAIFMVIRQAYKLDCLIQKIAAKTKQSFSVKGKSRKEIKDYLDSIAPEESDKQLRVFLDEAYEYLEILNGIKGVISLGAPFIFDKKHNPILPALLMSRFVMSLIGKDRVPVSLGKWFVKKSAHFARVAMPLINPDNFEDPEQFLAELILAATEDFPWNLGQQFLSSIDEGEGIKRLDGGENPFNYSASFDFIPTDLPIVCIIGEDDPLVPPYNLAFIDRHFAQGSSLDFSRFPKFKHTHQRVYTVSNPEDLARLKFPKDSSMVIGAIFSEVKHLDMPHGKRAEALIKPFIFQAIQAMWAA